MFDIIAFDVARQCFADSERSQGSLEEVHMKNTAVLILSLSLASAALVAQDAAVRPLLSKDLAGIPGKELSMITVEYKPGASDQVHKL